METPLADPGYGDPLAPVGSLEWAKRWRLCFQNVARQLPSAPETSRKFYEQGKQYRAWTLITDEHGTMFRTFEQFCECRQPWGLGIRPASKFFAYLQAEIGPRAAALETVAPGDDVGGRPTNNSTHREGSFPHAKPERLRAILRAPDLIQHLYREGLVSQTTATLMGPKQPDEDKAVRVVQARQAVEAIELPDIDNPVERRKYRSHVDQTIRRIMGKPKPTAYHECCRCWVKMTKEEKDRFMTEKNQEGW